MEIDKQATQKREKTRYAKINVIDLHDDDEDETKKTQ